MCERYSIFMNIFLLLLMNHMKLGRVLLLIQDVLELLVVVSSTCLIPLGFKMDNHRGGLHLHCYLLKARHCRLLIEVFVKSAGLK